MKIALICGGTSFEHAISLVSARNVLQTLEENNLYETFPIALSQDGDFRLIKADDLKKTTAQKPIDVSNLGQSVQLKKTDTKGVQIFGEKIINIDVCFPLLHGTQGEDGIIQGFLEFLQAPYIGNGVFTSSAGMDKDITRRLVQLNKVPSVPYCILDPHSPTLPQSFPVFIKPASQGSSIGVHKVLSEVDFKEAVSDSFKYSKKVLMEPAIKGRELEVAILETKGTVIASPPGEIIPRGDFYNYEAKYLTDGGADLVVPAKLNTSIIDEIQKAAKTVFYAMEARDLARIDFYLTSNGELLFNEINTMPGFTKKSMYPLLMKTAGFSYDQVLNTLIDNALQR